MTLLSYGVIPLILNMSSSTFGGDSVGKKSSGTNVEEGRCITQQGRAAEQKPESSTKVDVSSLAVSETITQIVHVCATHKKPRLLIKSILKIREDEKERKVRQPGAMIVFCTKIKTIKFVEDFLRRQSIKGVAIFTATCHKPTERAISSFRCGKDSILIATDVAARGLHIKKLKYVINYDFPTSLEQYCHRIGRTGRQGEDGQGLFANYEEYGTHGGRPHQVADHL